jgi:Tfp pilus assembly pilus retraction ATPase PilT
MKFFQNLARAVGASDNPSPAAPAPARVLETADRSPDRPDRPDGPAGSPLGSNGASSGSSNGPSNGVAPLQVHQQNTVSVRSPQTRSTLSAPSNSGHGDASQASQASQSKSPFYPTDPAADIDLTNPPRSRRLFAPDGGFSDTERSVSTPQPIRSSGGAPVGTSRDDDPRGDRKDGRGADYRGADYRAEQDRDEGPDTDFSPLDHVEPPEPMFEETIPGLDVQEIGPEFTATNEQLVDKALREALVINPSITDMMAQEQGHIWFKCASDTIRADRLLPNALMLEQPLQREALVYFILRAVMKVKTQAQAKAAWERLVRALKSRGHFDESIQLSWGVKIRVNVHRQAKGRLSLTARVSKSIPQTIEKIGLPQKVLPVLRSASRGLILITGPMSSGKTSTAQALLNHRNMTRGGHIVTIEDPIETDLRNMRCVISAKEVGTDVPTFSEGLVSALRQAADCILIGEMRDRDTIKTAINASASGVLVIATVHGDSCAGTIGKMMSMLGEEGPGYWDVLSQNLVCVIRQAKVPSDCGTAWFIAADVLINSPDSMTRELLRRGALSELDKHIADKATQTGEYVSMNDRLRALIANKDINLTSARTHATDPKLL